MIFQENMPFLLNFTANRKGENKIENVTTGIGPFSFGIPFIVTLSFPQENIHILFEFLSNKVIVNQGTKGFPNVHNRNLLVHEITINP